MNVSLSNTGSFNFIFQDKQNTKFFVSDRPVLDSVQFNPFVIWCVSS